MGSRYTILIKILALMLAALFITGCSQSSEAPNPSIPQTTSPTQSSTPTDPTDPTDPPPATPHKELYDYLVRSGSITIDQPAGKFTMGANNGSILLAYKTDAISVAVTLTDGATLHPVDISFSYYTAKADVDPATYSTTTYELSNFRCQYPEMADSSKIMATTAVWSCFVHAATAMEPSGVDLVSLGFVNYI